MKNKPIYREGRLRIRRVRCRRRRCMAEFAGELLLHAAPELLFCLMGAVGGTVWLAYWAGGVGFALMLIPVWIWLFYRLRKHRTHLGRGKNGRR